MITAKVIKGQDLGKRFKSVGAPMNNAVQRTVLSLAIKLTGRVKQKLSGEVLNVRTGRLRRSIHHEIESIPGSSVAIVGTNVIYARIHEYGGVIVPKQAKALRFQIGDKWVVCQKVTMPERSFLRSALREVAPEIRSELEKTARVVFQGI